MLYKSLAVALKAIKGSYRRRWVYPVETTAHLSAYFLHLRADLDNKPYPALVVECKSGSILSNNLPAFELLAIDAVGFRLPDFMSDPETYKQMVQQLQHTGKNHQTIVLHDADGQLIECKVNATITPFYPGWMIFRFSANQQSLCPLHSSR